MVIDSSGNLNLLGTVTESTTPTFDVNDFNSTGGLFLSGTSTESVSFG